ncbi:hypothetical protein JXD20_02400 [Candidatus Peregrinibacteria bacterium]|nr:hypothetical protein [Candidatus Peregrinibacteria bacterium]
MPERPSTESIQTLPRYNVLSKIVRNKLAVALMIGTGLLGCREENENIINIHPPTFSAVPEPSQLPQPEIPRCERDIVCKDEAEHAFTPKKNIEEVMSKYKGAKYLVDTFSGNGCRNAAVFVPRAFKPDKKIELIYHFHGSHGNLIGVPLPYDTIYHKEGTITKGKDRFARVLWAIDRKAKYYKRNAILIYPMSAGKRAEAERGNEMEEIDGYKQGYDDVWMKRDNSTCDSMQRFDEEIRQRLMEEWNIDASKASVTITGHSAGGKAILRIVQSGYRPNLIKFLDSSYDYWAEETYEGILKTGSSIPVHLYVKPNTSTQKGAEKIEGKKNVFIIPSEDPDMRHGRFVDYI